ncbi:SAC3/GANP/Nin1/mts3/eIF-3 p25 family-domain-containing protein [Mucor lusitanicus]|uniref:SAC3/GANP/Nin1/mts3/eIF-3 p25 family-domain-containing protein n=2 Tax=Mucor circinelloides f. lusitanicus TaxID=29924 RepID=A0A8H4F5Z2_MUCCL|nr:SAC3/GANP/Nin1/mts3/eIF-3 p25 family-domain-containing protein [Mucor lusitanicus]
MFAQQSNHISPFNQRMDNNQGKQSVFLKSNNPPVFGQNTGFQNQAFSGNAAAPSQSVFGNKPATSYKQSLVFPPAQQKNDHQNQNSVFFGQQPNDNQNRMALNQRGRGRGRGNVFHSTNSNRGRKAWGHSGQSSLGPYQHQSQEQPQQPSPFQSIPNQSTPPAQQQQQQQQQPRQKRQHQAQRTNNTPQPAEQLGQVTAAERAKRFGSTDKSDLYNQLKKMRVQERQQAIDAGLLPDPDNPTTLEEAVSFRGTCVAKCPEFEIAERDYQNLLEPFEKDQDGNVDPEKCVKAYRRSAAGVEQPLPSDVRTPEALMSTLDYLIDETLTNNSLEQCHAFVRDRTRSIRQDFTLQNVRDITAVAAHERIARFHILCLHEMCEVDRFSMQQELEQLNKVLLSLTEFYDDLREEGIESENEAEFRAYHLISHIRDQELARQAQTLPIHIFRHPYMKRALELHALSQRNNEIMETSSRRNKPENIEASQNYYTKLFKLIADDQTSFLMACMMECHFSDIRKGALKAMNTAYLVKASGVPVEHVRRVLAYDSSKQLLEELMLYGMPVDMSLGVPTIIFGVKHFRLTKTLVFREPLSNPAQTRSMTLVEPKKGGRSFRDIINATDSPSSAVHDTHMVASAQASSANAWMNTTVVPPTTFKRANDLQQSAQEKQKQLELESIRSRVAAQQAQLDLERKKVEAAMQKKKLEEESLKQQQEQQRLLKEQEEERKRLEIEQIKAEIAKREEEARVRQEQERIKRERERELKQQQLLEILRKDKEAKEAARLERLRREKIEALQDRMHRQRISRAKTLIRRRFTPLIHRVRERIDKRNAKAVERHRMWHFNLCVGIQNPYSSLNLSMMRPLHSTPEGIRERVSKCMLYEKYALEDVKQPLQDQQAAIWRTEDFSLNIYPRIRDKMFQKAKTHDSQDKPEWQLFVNVPDDEQLDSSTWFSRKFGFDNEFHSRKYRYQEFDITTRMITPSSELPSKWVDEAGAIIFSLPESKESKMPQEIDMYWSENKQRLDKLTADLQRYNPGKQIPILFTYFADTSNTESTLEKIPTYLGLDTNRSISDYHFLFMNPLTITTRIMDEINWLSTHSSTIE